MTYKIPAWLTAPEEIPGEPLSRIREILHVGSFVPQWAVYIREAIRAFDAKSAELEETKQVLCHHLSIVDDAVARAEKAEAECARLREELASYKKAFNEELRK